MTYSHCFSMLCLGYGTVFTGRKGSEGFPKKIPTTANNQFFSWGGIFFHFPSKRSPSTSAFENCTCFFRTSHRLHSIVVLWLKTWLGGSFELGRKIYRSQARRSSSFVGRKLWSKKPLRKRCIASLGEFPTSNHWRGSKQGGGSGNLRWCWSTTASVHVNITHLTMINRFVWLISFEVPINHD